MIFLKADAFGLRRVRKVRPIHVRIDVLAFAIAT